MVKLEAVLPMLPDDVRMYRLRPPKVNRGALAALARRFDLHGSERVGGFYQDRNVLRYTESYYTVMLHRASGGVRFYDKSRWQRDWGEGDVKLSDRRAIAIAERFVTERELADSGEYDVLKVSRLNVGTVELESGTAQERVIDVAVAFQRVVDGLPVDGPGGKLVVYIGHGSQITGCEFLWRDIASVARQRVELRSPESVLERLARRYALRRGSMTVEAFRFGYFELGWNDRQAMLQPAYVVLLKLATGERAFRVRKVEVTPAATRPVPGLAPRRRRPTKEQQSRRETREA
ncbi:MAG TPA: hypothetical protein VES65_10545 [Solirubrobacteraceae bacterium]|nr:hypothetical protein [Solirubrobacteraceae bacterium]